jgi:hypothetical protein
MGFNYRKSVKMGPFRVTASKSGISYSAGVSRRSPAIAPKAAPATKPARAPRPVRAPKPVHVPAPKVARTRKPVRLRGQRSTTPPLTPPAWLLPCTIKGNLATVTLHQGGIHIERTRAGQINGNHSADISWQQLAGIDFLKPNFFRNGHVHFAAFGDPRGLTSTGNGDRMAASARNPHAVLFAWHQSRAYRQLRDLLTGASAVPPPPHQPPPPTWQEYGRPPQQPPFTRGYTSWVQLVWSE